jgi:hypothetical protein
MKIIVSILFSLSLTFAMAPAVYADCGSCGSSEKADHKHDHSKHCQEECKDSKDKTACEKKCKDEHKKEAPKKEAPKKG